MRQSILALSGSGILHHPQEQDQVEANIEKTDKLNNYIMSISKSRMKLLILLVRYRLRHQGGRFDQLFLLAIKEGNQNYQSIGNFAYQILKVQHQKIIRDNVTLDSDEENISELTKQAKEFLEKYYPILKALKIA